MALENQIGEGDFFPAPRNACTSSTYMDADIVLSR